MSLLDHPRAQALLGDAELSAATVRGCLGRLHEFLQRYLPLFARREQRELAKIVVQGRLSGLERKTSEPIAYEAGHTRKPVQNFVGAGAWDDEAVMAELRRHVGAEVGDAAGVLILDPSSFAKKGTASCGVARQWCGRLGKVDNCQVGVFWGYASERGCALVDGRLYVPKEQAQDRKHRRKTYIPAPVVYQPKWRIGLERLQRIAADLPHGWIAADDEFGRVTAFRGGLRARGERYVVDVPSNSLVREFQVGQELTGPFTRVDIWARQQPSWRWQKVRIRPGEKGELAVRVLTAVVQTKNEKGRVGTLERVVVMRNINGEPRTWYALSNAWDAPLEELVRVKSARHTIEDLFQQGKGEVGLHHYEVRSWVGWHHHMTLSMLALWFLNLEKREVGGKNTGDQRGPNSRNLQPPVASARTESGKNRPRNHPNPAPQRRSPHLPLAAVG
jgi:SRSO17 transposase